jgi:pterin-4a-carbinolamine dehydratase
LTTELYALKIRRYLREATRRRNLKDFYAAGIFYKRAARTAYQANKSPKRYESLAIACFEKQIENSLSIENFSQAADAIEHIAKIHEQNGDTQTAADLRLQASYLRLKGIETLMA